MLRRNRFGFRMRRRSMTNRLLQFVVVLSVSTLFICLLLYAVNFPGDQRGPDFSWLKTRNMTAFIRPGDISTTLIEPKKPFCRADQKLRLLVAVHSSPNHTERRRIIRKTWGEKLKKLPGVKVLYNFGRSSNSSAQNSIREEHMFYNDVLQHDFVDSFANLTLKTTFLLKWIVSNNCSTVKFLFKVDDDSFVNPKRLWTALDHALLHTTTRKSLQPFAGGEKVIKEKEYHEITTPSTNHLDAPNGLPMQILNARIKPNVSEVQPVNGNNDDLNLADHPILPIPQKTIVDSSGKILPVAFARNFDEYPKSFDVEEESQDGLSESVDYLIMGYVKHTVPIRDQTHKLYLPHRFYPLNIFPRFVGGAGYVVTTSVLPALYECLLRTPYMNLEDVMMMGLCATTQIGLRLTHNPLFRNKRPEVGPNYVCYYKESPMMHPVDPIEMEEMWVRILDNGHNCDTFYFAFVQRLSLVVEFVKNLLRL